LPTDFTATSFFAVSNANLVLIAFVGLSVLFAGLYALARRIDNYGIVDIAWSYAFGAMTVFYAMAGAGWPARRLLIAALVVAWSLRLGTHLWIRIGRHHPEEDGRYRQLRQDWSAAFAPKMFGFFQMQAASVVVLGAGFLAIGANAAEGFGVWEFAGAAIWLIAIAGETLADAQLAAFKREATGKTAVCDTGLWRYSRHPNYFFEWLVWVAYFVFALGSPYGLVAIIGPISILWLLLRVTGIPLTEEQSLRSRGDAYRRYQQTTSAFVPWFPRKISHD
jgi:steroid 5-alpha reductase family enzyme